jgi:uncharacterized protein (TIGR02246 family)
MKTTLVLLALAAGAVIALSAARDGPPTAGSGPAPATAPQPPAAQPVGPAEAGVKAITAEYEAAFNAADAKAAAALWTAEGEYVGADGAAVTGRAALEKSLTDFFKQHPGVKAEVRVEAVRPIGRGTATVEGFVRLRTPGDDPVVETRYTALHVLEDGKWHAASVKEWVPDPATAVTPKQLDWLVGEWAAKGEAGDVRVTYTWDENKVFLHAKYVVTKDGKPVLSGMQVIGANPGGGLRSWTFDSTGATGGGVWVRDGTRWLCETAGVLPDGTEVTALNVAVRIGPDAFTWQTTDRAADGVPLPALPPVKVTRVKK